MDALDLVKRNSPIILQGGGEGEGEEGNTVTHPSLHWFHSMIMEFRIHTWPIFFKEETVYRLDFLKSKNRIKSNYSINKSLAMWVAG